MEQNKRDGVENAGWWQRLGFGVAEAPPEVPAQRSTSFEVMP